MKRTIRIITIITILCMAFSFSTGISFASTSTGTVYVKATQNYYQAQQVLKLVNKERTKRGLGKLKMDKTLTNAAIKRAAEIGIYIPTTSPHRRPNGKLAHTVAKGIVMENCAEGYTTAKGVVKDWMNSAPHKKAILLKSAKSIGIASVTTSGNDHNWVLEFSNAKAKKVVKSTKKKSVTTKKVIAKKKYIKKKSYFWLGASKSTVIVGKKITLTGYYASPYMLDYTSTKLAGKTFYWSSSNKAVATVSKTGVVTGKKKGTATITAKLKKGPSIKVSFKVQVKAAAPLKLNKTKASVAYGKPLQLKVKNASGTVTWSSSDTSVAKVSSKGVVTAVSSGKAIITAKVSGKKLTCDVRTGAELSESIAKLQQYIKEKGEDWTWIGWNSTIEYTYNFKVEGMLVEKSETNTTVSTSYVDDGYLTLVKRVRYDFKDSTKAMERQIGMGIYTDGSNPYLSYRVTYWDDYDNDPDNKTFGEIYTWIDKNAVTDGWNEDSHYGYNWKVEEEGSENIADKASSAESMLHNALSDWDRTLENNNIPLHILDFGINYWNWEAEN